MAASTSTLGTDWERLDTTASILASLLVLIPHREYAQLWRECPWQLVARCCPTLPIAMCLISGANYPTVTSKEAIAGHIDVETEIT